MLVKAVKRPEKSAALEDRAPQAGLRTGRCSPLRSVRHGGLEATASRPKADPRTQWSSSEAILESGRRPDGRCVTVALVHNVDKAFAGPYIIAGSD